MVRLDNQISAQAGWSVRGPPFWWTPIPKGVRSSKHVPVTPSWRSVGLVATCRSGTVFFESFLCKKPSPNKSYLQIPIMEKKSLHRKCGSRREKESDGAASQTESTNLLSKQTNEDLHSTDAAKQRTEDLHCGCVCCRLSNDRPTNVGTRGNSRTATAAAAAANIA
jgi:hypothetical protein